MEKFFSWVSRNTKTTPLPASPQDTETLGVMLGQGHNGGAESWLQHSTIENTTKLVVNAGKFFNLRSQLVTAAILKVGYKIRNLAQSKDNNPA